MNFREAFERYKAGTATPEEAHVVERELEKNRLISDYLAEDLAEDITVGDSPSEELKSVRKSMRRRSRNIVVTAVAVMAVLALLFYFAGIPLLNGRFYNPMTITESRFVYDFDVAMAAYTELFLAGHYHGGSIIKNTGIGRYEMTLIQGSLTIGGQEYYAVTLDRNVLTAPYALKAGGLSANVFARASYPVYNLDDELKARYDKALAELPGYFNVSADVSFSEDLTMARLLEFMRGSKVSIMWAGIRNAPEHTQLYPLCGMGLTGTGLIYEKVSDTYPGFELAEHHTKNDLTPEDYENHFKSLLRYAIDHGDFLKAIGDDRDLAAYCESVLGYVSENGVKTYGVMVSGKAEDILALKDTGVVSQIWPMAADITF